MQSLRLAYVDYRLEIPLTPAEMASYGYTCITCRVAFADADLQRGHYKTDWHRYNLKRKVAELPPVTADNFQERVLAQRAINAGLEARQDEYCQICKKRFTSQNSFDSHVRSRKHREKQAVLEKRGTGEEGVEGTKASESASSKNKRNLEESSSGETGQRKDIAADDNDKAVDSNKEESGSSDYEPEPLDITECLFCPHMSDDLEANLHHMSRSHGFFIPELDYLVDIKALIKYLCEKVGVGYLCLHCNDRGKTFHSVEAVQHHMVDKCHCKMFFEGDAALEYAEFYDYSKSYPDDAEELERTPEGSSKAVALQSPDTSLTVTDDLELVLPSGAKVGHRSLRQFYKQHLPTLEHRKSALVGRLMAQYKALGWKGAYGGEGAAIRGRDESWARRMQQARAMKLGVKANKLQTHFRPQVIF